MAIITFLCDNYECNVYSKRCKYPITEELVEYARSGQMMCEYLRKEVLKEVHEVPKNE